MKKFIQLLLAVFILTSTFFSQSVFCQSPQAIPYQAIARNNTGEALVNQNIKLRLSIRNTTSTGLVVYSETQTVTTTNLGLFTIYIGLGTPIFGTLTAVNWSNGAKFIQVELDPTGGNSFTNMGTTQLMSVPYALFAAKSGDLPTGAANGNTLRWNGTTWVADNTLFNNGSNIGIGTTSPSAKLEIAGQIKITGGNPGSGKVLKSDALGLGSWSTLSGIDLLNSPIPANLSCPVLTGSVTIALGTSAVEVMGDYAYVLNGISDLMQVVNISNPSMPTVVSSVSSISSRALTLSGNYAYVLNYWLNTMQVIDIANPASPTVVSTVATGSNPHSVAVSGNYAYVVNIDGNTMQVFNISNPASPTLISSVATGNGPTSVAISGIYAYVVNRYSNNVQVINISNPVTPTVVGTVATGVDPRSVALLGNYAYVVNVGNNTMQVINISNPTLPTVIGSVGTGLGPLSIKVGANYAYVVNSTNNAIQVIDISNPASPMVVTTVGTATGPHSLSVSGNYAYVVHSSSTPMQVFNLACPENYAITVNPASGQTTALPYPWNTSGNDISSANNGNVGIGATSPLKKLDIQNKIGIFSGLNGEPTIKGLTTGWTRIGGGGGLALWSDNNVETNNTPQILIHSNSKVGIGTSEPTAKLSVNGNANNTTGSWSVFSDARVKKVQSDFTDGLTIIKKINPVKFTYNAEAPFKADGEQVGVVAQELEKIAPYMVSKKEYGDIKDLREVNNQAYVFLLINAVKDLAEQNEALQKQMELQQKQIEELQKLFNK